MFKIIFLGVLLTATTMLLHTAGTLWWVEVYKRRAKKTEVERSVTAGMVQTCLVIGWTAVMLLLLHFVEVTVWAVAYCLLPEVADLATFEDAIYFSMVTFTTLGFGDLVIENSWRLLSGIQAVSGTFVFGWSSALLFAALIELNAPRLNPLRQHAAR